MTTVAPAIQRMVAWQAANQQHFAYSENSGRLDPEHSGYTDCSGLTRWLYLKFAQLDIGTWTGDESTHGTLVTVSKSQARNGVGMLPGDLIFYRWAPDSPATFDHVNMFVGDGMVQNHGGPGRGPVEQSLMTNVDSATTVMVRRYITQEDDMQLTDTFKAPDGKEYTVALALGSMVVNARKAALGVLDPDELATAIASHMPSGDVPDQAALNTAVKAALASLAAS